MGTVHNLNFINLLDVNFHLTHSISFDWPQMAEKPGEGCGCMCVDAPTYANIIMPTFLLVIINVLTLYFIKALCASFMLCFAV